jgi:hypothetical protein
MKGEKTYKASFKTYQNSRLKTVSFHGKDIYPLYIQLSFDRQTIYFKSYYFDLLSRPQYAADHFTGTRPPSIKDIVAKEEKLIYFIIDKYADHFSLELFKEKYEYYNKDILSVLDEGFKEYLYIFFNDEGDNLLATMVSLIGKYESSITILDGFKNPLKPALYDKILLNATYYAPPYLPLIDLAGKKGEGPLTTLSVFEWGQNEIQQELDKLLEKSFQQYNKNELRKYISKLIGKL